MSFIPSFILSTMIFCTVSVSGGWNGATLTEGIRLEMPSLRLDLSVTGTPSAESETGSSFPKPALKNAAVTFQDTALSLKLAAGSLAVSGMNGNSRLTAASPGKSDGNKPLAFYAGWKDLSLIATSSWTLKALSAASSQDTTSGAATSGEPAERPLFNHVSFQFHPGFFRILPEAPFKAELQDTFTAGWSFFNETKETGWYLRYPWHSSGNLFFMTNMLTGRFTFPGLKVEAGGTLRLSLPDLMLPAAGGTLSLLMKTERTETSLSLSGAPSFFMTQAGSFISETVNADISFIFETTVGKTPGKKSTAKTLLVPGTLKVTAASSFTRKQPASARAQPKKLLSAETGCSYSTDALEAGVSLSAEKLCIEDACRDGVLTPALEMELYGTSLSAKVNLYPFQDASSGKQKGPAWVLKAEHAADGLAVSYSVEFSGAALKSQEFSVTEERGPVSLSTTALIKESGLVWNLVFSRIW